MGAYRRLWADARLRTIYLLSIALRLPIFGTNILLTLHVVGSLGRSYGEAGLVAAAYTVAQAVSNPWRGHLIDRQGLRRTLLPSLIIQPVLWAVIPFSPFWGLFPLVVVAGLTTVPTFSVLRQALVRASSEERRQSALSLDSVMVELAFMAGPLLAVMASTAIGARWALLGFGVAAALASLLLYIVNPAVGADHDAADHDPHARWLSGAVLAYLAIMGAAVFVLAGAEVTTIAALRSQGADSWIGLVMAAGGLGSAIGGLVYGSLHRPIHPAWLLAGLALTTAPMAWAGGPLALGALFFLSGVCCAPTISSTVDHLSRVVPASRLGQVMGWHGSFGTAGGALGAPAMGWVVDHRGWPSAFLAAAGAGLALAVLGGALVAGRRRVRARRA